MLLRLLLDCAAIDYVIIIRLRNLFYRLGWLKTHHIQKPVISVGNITTGGTGKTPLVIWLCNFLTKKNLKAIVLTRGYKTEKGKFSDEPATLAMSCPDAKIIVNSNRVEAAEKAMKKFSPDILVMDDGFQHRRLARDLNIVTIDATNPFGYGKILPAGLLREPLSALKRAHGAVITRCDQADDNCLKKIEQKLLSINPDMIITKSVHTAVCVKVFGQSSMPLEELNGKNIFAFCGIGNPNAFFETAKKLGCNLVGQQIYNDHYNYTPEDINDIYEQTRYLNVDLILSTQKDWTKASVLIEKEKDIDFGYLEIQLKIISGGEKITSLIETIL